MADHLSYQAVGQPLHAPHRAVTAIHHQFIEGHDLPAGNSQWSEWWIYS